ncbi:enoyl-CoA hydratase/isomerase family protein [Hippea jasoniae]|uniref:enoyl-CoA hydratase/isomerase family protein n=1 Tax=Hippea jasoniae TaxID=944479 RepID=UPI00055598EE|nr:enoyl-CoA hydratase-related protein [Hippea jasoniae]
MDNVIVEIEKPYAVITVNREKKLNALDVATIDELSEAVNTVENNDDVRAVIITGAGDKAFIAGADIAFMQSITPKEAYEFARKGQSLIYSMMDSTKPFIAAVNGYALGGGFEVALGCDFILATDNAKFGFPEVSLGIIPGFGGTQNLSRVVGKNTARYLILTTQMIKAKEAQSLGIVSNVFETKDELLSNAKEIATKIAENGPVAISLAKKAINDGFDLSIDEALKYEATLFGVAFSTEDAKEGLKAFIEKRKPQYEGK